MIEYSGLVVTYRTVLSAYDAFVGVLAGGAYRVGVPVVGALGGSGKACLQVANFVSICTTISNKFKCPTRIKIYDRHGWCLSTSFSLHGTSAFA